MTWLTLKRNKVVWAKVREKNVICKTAQITSCRRALFSSAYKFCIHFSEDFLIIRHSSTLDSAMECQECEFLFSSSLFVIDLLSFQLWTQFVVLSLSCLLALHSVCVCYQRNMFLLFFSTFKAQLIDRQALQFTVNKELQWKILNSDINHRNFWLLLTKWLFGFIIYERDFVDVTTTTTRMTWINQHISCHLTVPEATHSSRDRQHVMLPKWASHECS